MSRNTRGPRPGRIPPHIEERVERKLEKRAERIARGPWYRRPLFIGALVALVLFVVGIMVGRISAPDPVAEAAVSAEEVFAAAGQARLVWDVGTPQGLPPVQQGLDALADGDPAVVTTNLDTWLSVYDQAVSQLRAGAAEPAGDGVRRVALAATQLARDAVESLGAAVTVDGPARDLMLDEVRRLHARSEELFASAEALLAELRGAEPATPATPSMPTLPRPGATAGPTDGASPQPTVDASPTLEGATSEPTPTTS